MSDLIARLEATAEDWPANLVALELEAAAALRQKEEQVAHARVVSDELYERLAAAERELAELRAQQPVAPLWLREVVDWLETDVEALGQQIPHSGTTGSLRALVHRMQILRDAAAPHAQQPKAE